MKRGFESRGGCGGQVKVEVDRHKNADLQRPQWGENKKSPEIWS